jgi:acetyl esterase
MQKSVKVTAPSRGELKPGLRFGYVDVPEKLTPETRPFLDSLTRMSLDMQAQIRKGREIRLDTQDITISAGGVNTRVRMFLPQGDGPFALILYCHGGGFAIRDVECFDYIGRYLAKNSGAVVAMPDYWLTPEHPYPMQLHQCFDTLLWAIAHAGEYRLNPDWTVVAGDSAGGNLSTAICQLCKERGIPQPALQMLAYPVVDMRVGPKRESEIRYGKGFNLDYQHVLSYNDAYATPAQRETPLVSPLVSAELTGLAPCCMILAECDVLIDQGLEYLQHLQNAGVDIRYRIYKGMPHDFLFFAYDESYEAYDWICDEVRAIKTIR